MNQFNIPPGMNSDMHSTALSGLAILIGNLSINDYANQNLNWMNPELGFAVCPAMENYFRPLSLLREMNSPSPIGVFRTMVAPNASSQMAYSSTSLISPGPQGCQMVYKATSSARSGPGDVCEIHDSVYNGSSGTKRRRTGRHYRNRSHIVEQGDNLMPGFREHKVGLSNIGNDEVSEFVEEYQRKAPWHTESSNAAPWPDYTERGHHMAFITSPTSPALLSSRPGRVWKYIPRSRSNGTSTAARVYPEEINRQGPTTSRGCRRARSRQSHWRRISIGHGRSRNLGRAMQE